MTFDLSDEIAVVTGGTRGIGRAISTTLAASGATVVANYYSNEQAAAETDRLLGEHDDASQVLQFDVSNADEVHDGFAAIEAEIGRPTILVNNAGILEQNTVDCTTEDCWDRVIDVNLKGTFLCSREVVGPMREMGHGSIVNISSVARENGAEGLCAYAATKGGQVSLTKVMAREYGPHGIRTNAVAPGLIETDIWKETSGEGMLGGDEAEVRSTWAEQSPLGRVGYPDDVASVTAFLASGEAAYVNGEVVTVDGGTNL